MHPRNLTGGRERVRRGVARTIVALTVLGAALPTPALALEPIQMTIAAMGPGTNVYAYSVVVAEKLRPMLPPGSRIDLAPIGGGVAGPKLVAGKKVDFAYSFSLTNQWALRGKHGFERELATLRGVIGALDRMALTILVTRDSGITSLEDLKEKRGKVSLGTLPVGTMGDYGARNLLEVIGLTYDDIRKAGGAVTHTGWPAIAAGVRDGRINTVIGVSTPGHGGVTEIALYRDVHFLPLSEKMVAAMQQQFGYTRATNPAGAFRGMDRDLPTVGVVNTFITHKDVPEDVVYLMTKAWGENKAAVVAAHKALAGFDPSVAWKPELLGLPLHPGAERYYREKGWLK